MSARVFALSDHHLSVVSVQQLATQLRAVGDAWPLVVDLAAVGSFAPEALAALLELGRSQSGLREVALAGLSRGLTLAAIQAGLAERFVIYKDAAAAERALREPPR